MPEVLEATAPISNVPQPTVYVPADAKGVVATVQESRTVGRAPSAVAVLVPEPEPEVTGAFKLTTVDGVPTMTSLEIVAYINFLRKQKGDDTELTHRDFCHKLREKVLKKDAAKFSAPSFYEVYGNKRERTIYVLPERETMLMVMSYDIDMQATVYDAWQAEKTKNAAPVIALPNFDDPVAAAEAWIAERKQANVSKLELSTANDALVQSPVATERNYTCLSTFMRITSVTVAVVVSSGMNDLLINSPM
ncbi:hypothetical protein [Duganella sp. BuS-21]|uniref:hypothetical protein n=1 Tax=Duganella sp. BuS-21 TaxID=2943848 RepID=UPI0035A7220F